MGAIEKNETFSFSTPSYNTICNEVQLPTSISHQNLTNVRGVGHLRQAFTDTVDTRGTTRSRKPFASLKINLTFLSAPAVTTFSKACRFIGRLFHSLEGKDQPVEDEGKLIVKDSRSGKSYDVPIRRGSVDAMQFRQMITTSKISATLGRPIQGSLKVLDVGYQNTACAESNITFVWVSRPFPSSSCVLTNSVMARMERSSSEGTTSSTFTRIVPLMRSPTC